MRRIGEAKSTIPQGLPSSETHRTTPLTCWVNRRNPQVKDARRKFFGKKILKRLRGLRGFPRKTAQKNRAT
ncbi:MAG: hypothetical protein Q8R02_14600, partial [Hyphomonadaceae bacterium]|nr:hypothetical protein [Hyphomonadaceae bacterium]